MRTLARDLRHAARSIRRTPGFTAIVVFTLALGIGANAAIFSVANVALLHPLPYDRPDQIVLVTTVDSKGKQGGAQPADFLDWRAQNRVFEHLAAKIDWTSYRLTDNSDPVEVVGSPVSATFFPLLRVQPIVGRAFLEGEDQPGAPGAAIISEQLWESRYRRDPRILSRSIKIDGRPYTVVGVMPAGFSLHETRGERRDQLWIPFAQQFDARQLAIRETTYQLRVWARLKSGITLEQAQAEMDVIAHRLEQQNPKTNTGRRDQRGHGAPVLAGAESDRQADPRSGQARSAAAGRRGSNDHRCSRRYQTEARSRFATGSLFLALTDRQLHTRNHAGGPDRICPIVARPGHS